MKKTIHISYQDRLLLCFLAGVAGGTLIANLLSSELQSQTGYFNTLFLPDMAIGDRERQQLWLFVTRQRVFEMLGAWLIGLTVCSAAGYYVLAVLAGGSVAVVVTVMTLQKGLTGLVFYLASVMPQALFYVPVCLILASWAGREVRKIRLGGTGILLLMMIAGTVAEVYINPFLMELFQK